MEKIIFEDLPSTKTPLNAENLNQLQTNVENAINDVNKTIDNKMTYSTEEKVVSTWIDGKPIYRKVFYFGSLPTNSVSGTLSIAHNIENINFITSLSGIAYNSSTGGFKPIPNVDPWTLGKGIYLEANATKVAIKTDSVQNDFVAYIIFEYTKTTD